MSVVLKIPSGGPWPDETIEVEKTSMGVRLCLTTSDGSAAVFLTEEQAAKLGRALLAQTKEKTT